MRSSCAAIALLALLAFEAPAQSWPVKPIRFLVPFPPGGANDLLPRLFSDPLGASLGQPVVVENRPGAGSNVGTAFAASQAPDGHSLLLASVAHVVNVSFFKKLPYDPIRDFAPVSMVATIPFVMTVNSSLGVGSARDLIAYLKSRPGSTYATAGIGTSHHLSAELLKTMTGVEITHVPYKGAQQIVPALLSGEVTFSIASISSLVPHFKSGKLKALAVAGSERTTIVPDVPTISEAAGLPGYAIDVWFGVLVPTGTPRPIIDRLNKELHNIARDPTLVREKLTPVGLSPLLSTPERFSEVMKADLLKYAKISKDAGIKPE
jgi:tripartite-type tricarboxylate transporter receptor subunit TctC